MIKWIFKIAVVLFFFSSHLNAEMTLQKFAGNMGSFNYRALSISGPLSPIHISFLWKDQSILISSGITLSGERRFMGFSFSNSKEGLSLKQHLDLILLKNKLKWKRKSLTLLEQELSTTLSFLINFISFGRPLSRFQGLVLRNYDSFINERSWKEICNKIGKEHEGKYTAFEKEYEGSGIVGEKDTRCLGRCGTGCMQAFQKKKYQYTQECFDHDLCTRTVGTILGECKDEFWTASDGYRNAENCPRIRLLNSL